MRSSGVGSIVNALAPVYPRAVFDYIGLALLIAVVVTQELRKVHAGTG